MYCVEPQPGVGGNRQAFLLHSLRDLHRSLLARGSRLLVLRGVPATVLPLMWAAVGARELVYEREDSDPRARERDAAVSRLAAAASVTVEAVHGHTLFDPHVLLPQCPQQRPPLRYASFCALLGRQPPVPEEQDAPPALPALGPGVGWGVLQGLHTAHPHLAFPGAGKAKSDADELFGLPTLAHLLGVKEEEGEGEVARLATSPHRGGESEARLQMARFFAQPEVVAKVGAGASFPAAAASLLLLLLLLLLRVGRASLYFPFSLALSHDNHTPTHTRTV